MKFEFELLYAIQGIHSKLLDNLMIFITKLGDVGFIWLLISIVLIFISMILEYKSKKEKLTTNYDKILKLRYMGLTMIIALILEVFTVNICLKNIVNRPRPFQVDESINMLITASGSSFPSGHTGSSFAAAVSVFLYNKKAGIAALVLASLIGFSRMYLFVHFPTDVIGGVVVGIICAFLARKILSKLFSFINEKRKDHMSI